MTAVERRGTKKSSSRYDANIVWEREGNVGRKTSRRKTVRGAMGEKKMHTVVGKATTARED